MLAAVITSIPTDPPGALRRDLSPWSGGQGPFFCTAPTTDDRGMDEPVDLDALAAELLADAAMQGALRAAHTLPHPVDGLRQTVIALIAGQRLAEHESPGPASLMVLRGRVRLVAGEQSVELGAARICPIPNQRHGVEAHEDSVLLLSVAVPQRAP
jgi:quercetin dioxygenase-like cupin family protein